MTMLAMNPEAYVDMTMGMHGMMLNVEPNLMLKLNGLRDMKIQPLDEKRMKELNEQLKNLKPFDEKQMKELNKQMEEMKKEFPPRLAAPEAPAPPAAPNAAPESAAPQTPAAAPQAPQMN
jgi:hypothetical protein